MGREIVSVRVAHRARRRDDNLSEAQHDAALIKLSVTVPHSDKFLAQVIITNLLNRFQEVGNITLTLD